MMEVKHSPTVSLMDYVSTNSDSNSVDRNTLLKNVSSTSKMQAEKLGDGLLPNIENIDDELDFHDAVDDREPINSDLEDALLADDELLAEPKTNFSLENLDKAENSTDPGDDLDKLLSKINDVVEGSNLIGNESKECEQVNGTNEEKAKNNVNEEMETVDKEITAENAIDIDEKKAQTRNAIDEDIVMEEIDDNLKEIKDEKEVKEKEKKLTSQGDENPTRADKKLEKSQIESDVTANEVEIEKNVTTSKINEVNKLENTNKNITKHEIELEAPTSETENKDKKVNTEADENSKEDEILDAENDSKNQSKEIFTLVLDDDDDDEEDVISEPAKASEKVNKLNKQINENEEIVCLDDDEDDEVAGVVTSEADSTVPKSETKNKATVAEVKPEKADSDVETEKPTNEAASKVSETDIKSKTTEVKSKIESKETKTCSKVDDTESTIKKAVIDDESKDDVTETASKSNASECKNEEELDSKVSKSELKSTDSKICAKDNVTIEDESKKSGSANKIEESTASKNNESVTATEEQTEKATNLISDNTDNACDGLEVSKGSGKAAEESASQNEDDARSEASSGSNLLQEGHAPRETTFETRDDADEEDAECEVEDGDDVVLLESDVDKAIDIENKEVEDDIEIPPAKKLRLSTDSNSNNKNKIHEENSCDNTEKQEKQFKPIAEQQEKNEKSTESEIMEIDADKVDEENAETKSTTSNNLKRPLSVDEETKNDETNESVVECTQKKVKTSAEEESIELTETKTKAKIDDNNVLEKLLNPAEASQRTIEEVVDVKQEPHTAVPSNKPIPLYPPPKFEETPKKLSLEFLQRFRKTFNQMTKNDLEELVLQKVVEALVYENQFADLRLIIEKQEKVIALHRSKLAQLVKQYRDLEMVHTRVVKDMREKNSQYHMPVRITRAVGLQVSSTNVRKPDGPIAQIAPNNVAGVNVPTVAVGIMRAPQSIQAQQGQQQQQKRLTSPQRPQAGNLMLPSSSTLTSPTAAAASVPTTAQPVRRGCMQKVTAQRPVNGTNVGANPPMASIPASSYSRPMPKATPSTSAVADNTTSNAGRATNKNAQTVSNSRLRYSSGSGNVSSSSPVQQAQQAKSPPQILNRQPTSVTNASKINAAVQNKIAQQAQFRRSDSSPTMGGTANTSLSSTSTAYMEQYKNSFNQAMPTVSITPARPKDKSVIDLTDEDDAPTPPPSMTPRTRVTPQPQMNANTANINSRQSMPPSLTRMPSGVSVRPQITPRQLSSMQAQKNSNAMQQQSTTITAPNGMSITRVAVNQANPATQRLRYSHPAPLPSTPPQAFNPGWKLPPPRPTIRISNLDNGIVISWTMEEALDRHAEVTTYQIYAYQETNAPPSTDSWRHVGDVKAMLLPMAVTLTQFQEDQRYFFSVRAMDTHQRYGPFSSPKTWN